MEKIILKEDIDKIKHLQNVYNQLIIDFGNFYYEKSQFLREFDEKEIFLKEMQQDFENKNIDFSQYMRDTYGEGNIDLEKGIILN